MELSELIDKYDFHDSSVTSLDMTELPEKLVLSIELCNWRQSYYTEKEPEIIEIILIFKEISYFDTYPKPLGFLDDEILLVKLTKINDYNEKLEFVIYDQVSVKSIFITAKEVNFIKT
ncbi:hypothetical protein V7O61_08200 [Methanolobus sp. WCC1]|jgi:hypothetical protein|uniref:hypothetical protein n=1 Tax=unclassified Methanolobus TaxID=2629569 RepID=UPI002590B3AC|nr:hypothetical protein [Methanolobus sp.]MDK2831111.1 hypothetical protein [Methanolobus sp.]